MEPEGLLPCLQELAAGGHFLSQINPVHTFPHYFPKDLFYNLILSSTPTHSEWSLPNRFSNQNIVCIFHPSHVCYMPFCVILFELITLITFGETYRL
jgi:hypothetical protein